MMWNSIKIKEMNKKIRKEENKRPINYKELYKEEKTKREQLEKTIEMLCKNK